MSDTKPDRVDTAFTQLSAELRVDRRIFASVTEELRRDIDTGRREAENRFHLLLWGNTLSLFGIFAVLVAIWARTGCLVP